MTEYFMLVVVRHEYRKLSYKEQVVRSGMYMGEAMRQQDAVRQHLRKGLVAYLRDAETGGKISIL